MGGTIAMLAGKGIETTKLVEGEIKEKRNNLLIAVLICVVIFIAIGYNYISTTWLWITIPTFVITTALLILTEMTYWNITYYTIPAKTALEMTEVAAQLI